ncbi:Protein of unknown function, partial [Gryllus bimaculatus]
MEVEFIEEMDHIICITCTFERLSSPERIFDTSQNSLRTVTHSFSTSQAKYHCTLCANEAEQVKKGVVAKADNVAKAVVHLINNGPSGSVWVSGRRKNQLTAEFPEYPTMRVDPVVKILAHIWKWGYWTSEPPVCGFDPGRGARIFKEGRKILSSHVTFVSKEKTQHQATIGLRRARRLVRVRVRVRTCCAGGRSVAHTDGLALGDGHLVDRLAALAHPYAAVAPVADDVQHALGDVLGPEGKHVTQPRIVLTPKDRLRPTTACLVATYTGQPAMACRPRMDAMLATTPPRPPLFLPMMSKASHVPRATAVCASPTIKLEGGQSRNLGDSEAELRHLVLSSQTMGILASVKGVTNTHSHSIPEELFHVGEADASGATSHQRVLALDVEGHCEKKIEAE